MVFCLGFSRAFLNVFTCFYDTWTWTIEIQEYPFFEGPLEDIMILIVNQNKQRGSPQGSKSPNNERKY